MPNLSGKIIRTHLKQNHNIFVPEAIELWERLAKLKK